MAASNYLTYELYSDAGRTTVWSDAGAGSIHPARRPRRLRGISRSTVVSPSNQDVAAGSYSDTVVATVNF